VLIFNRTLSAEEVLTLYKRESPLASAGPDAKGTAEASKAPISVRADLLDGSVLAGEVKPDDLTFRSVSLGKVSAPLARICDMQWSEGGRKVVVN